MRIVAFVYDSTDPPTHVQSVLERLAGIDTDAEVIDAASPEDGYREAVLAVKEGVGIGSIPEELFDADGTPDFSAGALITEAPTGRRELHVGAATIEALRAED